MDLEKLLQKFEGLVFEIMILLILVPKTIFKLFTKPSFCCDYVDEQFDLPENKRFKDFVSPVLLVIVAFIVPLFFTSKYAKNQGNDDFFLNIPFVHDLSDQNKILGICLLVALMPILGATSILLIKEDEINYDNIKKPFYSFSYIISYYCISALPIFFSTGSGKSTLITTLVSMAALGAGMILTIAALVFYYKNEFNVGTGKAILYIFYSYLLISLGFTVLLLPVWLFK